MIQTSDSSRIYVGNNSTDTAYPVPFKFHDNEDLVVVVRDVAGLEETQLLGTDYTVVGANDPNGGSITTTWPVPATSQVSIVRVVPMTQLTAYEEGDSFPAKSHEKALDKLTMEVQQLARGMGTGSGGEDDIGTAFRVTEASGGLNPVSKRNDTMLGVDVMGSIILRTSGEMLGWLGQVGTAWANDAERLVTRGAFAGQVGTQLDNWTIYIAWSTTPGDWKPFLRFNGLVTSTNGVPGAKQIPAGDIVGTEESQVLTNKTLIGPSITDPSGLDKHDVGLSNVDNTADLNKPLSGPQSAAMELKEDKASKGVPTGYPSLDGGGKIPLAQIPDSVIGASQYQGTWNAATNTPTIPAAAVGNKGWYYSVSVAGTTNIDGINSWAVGDQIISNGAVWQKIINVSAVQSVNGKTGTVVINKADVGLPNVDNTSDTQKDAANTTLTNKTIRGSQQTLLEVRLDADVVNNLPVARLNGGTGAAGDTWWCGDNSWKKPPGTGDVNGPPTSTDGELTVYSGTTGKAIRKYTGTAGFAKIAPNTPTQAVSTIGVSDIDPLALVPVGVIMDFAGTTEPAGWIFCFGQSLVRTGTYAALFGIIGTTYGAEDGTHFNVPDLRGNVVAGRDNMGGTAANRLILAATGSTTNTSLIVTISGGTANICIGMKVVGSGIPAGAYITTMSSTTVTLSAAATATASGVALRLGIVDGFALGSSGGDQKHQLLWAEMPSHYHAIPQQITSGGAAGFPAGSYNVFNAGNTGTSGSDFAHRNLQPTIVLNKIIKY